MGAPRPILAPAPRTGPIEIAGRDPVPVTLLTGFLGSGKTTLLNRILNGDHGLRVGVLVNDFGDINIDAELVEGIEGNTVSLANGCICCELRDDLVASLEGLLARGVGIDYVIIEASGVAEPSGIALTFLDARYERLFRLDSITCLIDAEGIFAQDDDDRLNMLKLRQIGFADLVVLNKTDLVGPEHIEVVRDWIGLHMKRVRLVEAMHADVPMQILLGVGRFDPAALHRARPEGPGGEMDGAGFDRWSYRSSEPMSLEALREMVRRRLPETVYRCKGIIHAAEAPERRFVLQVVGRRASVVELGGWGDRPRDSEIVAIGRGMDAGSLVGLFEACRAT